MTPGDHEAQHAELLRAADEATLDGILVMDLQGRAIKMNDRFAEIFALPEDLRLHSEREPRLAHMRKVVADPAFFAIGPGDPRTVRDEVNFLDGRCFERYGTALWSPDGNLYGRVWYLHEVTAARRAARQAARLQAATARLVSARTVQDVVEVVLEEGTAGLGATSSALGLLEGDQLSFVVHGEVPALPREWSKVPLSTATLTTEVIRRREPIVLRNRTEAEALIAAVPGMAPLPDWGEHAWVALPMEGPDGLLGVIRFAFGAPRQLDDGEVAFVSTLASQCAQAIDRVLLDTAVQQAAARDRLRAQVADQLSASLDLEATMRTVVDLFVPDLADCCAIHLRGPEDRINLAAAGHREPELHDVLTSLLSRFRVTTQQPYGAGYAIATGQVQVMPEVTDDILASIATDESELMAFRQLGLGSGFIVPLIAHDRILGALSVMRASHPFSAEEVDLAEEIAQRAALAVDNARLYGEQRDVAVTLQRSLLPRSLPELDNVRLAHRYRPGASGTEVGGDLFDAYELPDGRLAFAVADVQGRGVRAAAVMGQLRAALRGYALEGHHPTGVIARADSLVQSLEDASFATAVYGELDPATGTLVLCGAGHPGPLLLGADGQTRFIDLIPGAPLGVGGIPFGSVELTMQPGDTLLCFTDGLCEGRQQPVGDGMEQLAIGMGERAHQIVSNPEAVCGAALAVMGRDQHHEDDVALIAVTFDGPAALRAGADNRRLEDLLAAADAGLLGPFEFADGISAALVPRLADWCVLMLRRDVMELLRSSHTAGTRAAAPAEVGEAMEILALRHRTPASEVALRELIVRLDAHVGDAYGSGSVTASGTSRLSRAVTRESMREVARDEAELDLLMGLHVGSAVVTPVVADGVVLGALNLARGPGRDLTTEDLERGESLGRRIGAALQTAWSAVSSLPPAPLGDETFARIEVSGLDLPAQRTGAWVREQVRAALVELFDGELASQESIDAALLVATELFANALRHSSRLLAIGLERRDGVLRVSVADSDPRAPILRPLDFEAESGRGMWLVEAMSKEWGVERPEGTSGKVVWADLALSPN